jgi:hypothetical protein
MVFAQAAEQFLGAGTGEEKKKVVVETIQKMIVAFKWEAIIPIFIQQNLGAVVDVIVFFYNAVGAFVHKK